MYTRVQLIKSSNINSGLIEEEMFTNRMNNKNLLESDWSADIQMVTMVGNVIYR
ncbi:hypothetical protein P3L10_004436 [Capsicum annuum]